MTCITAVQTAQLEEPPTIEHRVSIAKNLITQVGVLPQTISVVLSTGIDVYTQPSDSIAIASGIGADHALCASINNSCASISAAIELAMCKINGQPDEIAVVTSSSIFNEIHRDEKSINCANGVGATIISNNRSGFRIKKISHRINASFFGLKTIEPINNQVSKFWFNERKNNKLWKVYRQEAIDFPVLVMKDTLRAIGWNISNIDHWILHVSELTKCWTAALGIEVKTCSTNMGALTTLFQLDKLMTSSDLTEKNKIAVLELGLGLSVSVILLENEGDL